MFRIGPVSQQCQSLLKLQLGAAAQEQAVALDVA